MNGEDEGGDGIVLRRRDWCDGLFFMDVMYCLYIWEYECDRLFLKVIIE